MDLQTLQVYQQKYSNSMEPFLIINTMPFKTIKRLTQKQTLTSTLAYFSTWLQNKASKHNIKGSFLMMLFLELVYRRHCTTSK